MLVLVFLSYWKNFRRCEILLSPVLHSKQVHQFCPFFSLFLVKSGRLSEFTLPQRIWLCQQGPWLLAYGGTRRSKRRVCGDGSVRCLPSAEKTWHTFQGRKPETVVLLPPLHLFYLYFSFFAAVLSLHRKRKIKICHKSQVMESL